MLCVMFVFVCVRFVSKPHSDSSSTSYLDKKKHARVTYQIFCSAMTVRLRRAASGKNSCCSQSQKFSLGICFDQADGFANNLWAC